MAVINFDNYRVVEMVFYENSNFNENRNDGLIELETEFHFKFSLNDNENQAMVDISVIIGDHNSEMYPFFLNVSAKGFFTYNATEDEHSGGFDTYLKGNALAILYPYLRQTVSMLTMMSNHYPAYIMPTINIANLLKQGDETDKPTR